MPGVGFSLRLWRDCETVVYPSLSSGPVNDTKAESVDDLEVTVPVRVIGRGDLREDATVAATRCERVSASEPPGAASALCHDASRCATESLSFVIMMLFESAATWESKECRDWST
jgi:hypothetical protein